MIFQETLRYKTPGRGMLDLSFDLKHKTAVSGIQKGLCQLFLLHTSASLIICENADPDVQLDLEAFMQRLAPDGDPLYRHISEGSDDMSAHVRTILTQSSLTIPIAEGNLLLGRWQGVYLWEHRQQSYERSLHLTLLGEA